jgi:hypothetical protein
VLERLRAWDVQHVFAYPGDGINGILAAWVRADNRPMFIQSRHEETSASEAAGYAKFTGRVGVCMATSEPGAIHLLNGLYDAKLDHVAGGGHRRADESESWAPALGTPATNSSRLPTAYQLAAEPESAVTMASSGNCGESSERTAEAGGPGNRGMPNLRVAGYAQSRVAKLIRGYFHRITGVVRDGE